MVRTQVQLTPEQYDALRSDAERSRRSMAEVIRVALDAYLQKRKSRRDALESVIGKYKPLKNWKRGLGQLDVWHTEAIMESKGMGRSAK
jgi:Arc/MetJ-type ribon-helix-helix transcriptional regulator